MPRYWRKVCIKFANVDLIHAIYVHISLRVYIYIYIYTHTHTHTHTRTRACRGLYRQCVYTCSPIYTRTYIRISWLRNTSTNMSINTNINVTSPPYRSFQQNDLKLLPDTYIKFEVFTIVKTDIVVSCAVVSYGLVCWYWSFGEIYRLPLQGKVNAVPLHEKQEQMGCRNIAYLYSTPTLKVGGWPTPRPGRSIPGKETRYPFHRRLCEPCSRFGCVRKISPPADLETLWGKVALPTTLSRPPHLQGILNLCGFLKTDAVFSF